MVARLKLKGIDGSGLTKPQRKPGLSPCQHPSSDVRPAQRGPCEVPSVNSFKFQPCDHTPPGTQTLKALAYGTAAIL